MKKKYKDWILKNYSSSLTVLNKCHEISLEMNKNFPELVLTNGFIQVGIEKEMRTHWWLKDEKGEIIDPTSHQYQLFGCNIVFYQEIDDSHDLRNYPQSRCCHCGEKFFVGKNNWNNSTVCSSECFTLFAKSLK